jgi:hypothetical protein
MTSLGCIRYLHGQGLAARRTLLRAPARQIRCFGGLNATYLRLRKAGAWHWGPYRSCRCCAAETTAESPDGADSLNPVRGKVGVQLCTHMCETICSRTGYPYRDIFSQLARANYEIIDAIVGALKT